MPDHSKFFRELADEFGSGLDQANQNLSNWYQFDQSSFLERYLAGNICICLKGRIGFSENKAKDFICLLRNLRTLGQHMGQQAGHLRIQTNLPAHLGSYGNDDKKAMFIHDIKLMQDGQEVIIRRGLGLWLCTFNQTTGAHRKALYASTVNGLFEFLPRPTHGELMSVQGPMPVFHRKSNNQMIEDRTEVVYDFSGKNNKTEGNVDFPAHSPYIFSSLVLETTNDFIMHIILDKSIDFAIEVKDILISPLEFGSNS